MAWLAVIAITSLGLTWALRRYAMSRQLVDAPSERRSHQGLIPRGGGIAIAITFSGSLLTMWALGKVPTFAMLALAGGGGGIAALGFLDDHGHVPVRYRLPMHFIWAAWSLFWLGGMPSLTPVSMGFPAGLILNYLAMLYLVWMLNLYNFMDGIDGLASIEAVTVSLGGILMYHFASVERSQWIAPALLTASVVGFLPWNFPKARIFLGDSGSGFLGIVLALVSVQAASITPRLFWAWLILLGVFVIDATVTLFIRWWHGERIYEAHRTHAYQHAARMLGQHKSVSLFVAGINIFWLLPLGLTVALGHLNSFVGLLIAYAPLVGLAIALRAGVPEAVEPVDAPAAEEGRRH